MACAWFLPLVVVDGSSGAARDGDEVLRMHVQAAVGGTVVALGERDDLGAAFLPAAFGGEPLAGLEGRAVVGFHEGDPLLGGVEAPGVVPARELELERRAGEELADMALVAPQRRRRRVVGRRREVAAQEP